MPDRFSSLVCWMVALSPAACTPGIGVSTGTGGAGGAGVTAASTTQAQSSGPSGTASGPMSTSATSTSTGIMEPELQLYQHAYPFDTQGAVWTKSAISAVLGPDAPKQKIISALKLQNFDVLYLLTADEVVHYLHAGAWKTMSIDAMFPIPTTAKQDTSNPCMPTNPTGPPAVAVSTDPVTYMFHLPSLAGTCQATTTGEQVTLLGKTYGTVFEINPTTLMGSVFDVQRPYHADCYTDAYGPTEYALWGFDWANPAQCGLSAWYATFGWYSNHVLRSTGQSAVGPWAADDPNNPIFKTPAPANQPDPDAVVGAYFVQDANPATGTAVLIAP